MLFQSHRNDLYESVLADLGARGLHYPCTCSRSMLALHASEPGEEPVYPGSCRSRPPVADAPHALRFRIAEDAKPVRFEDGLQGPIEQDCRREAGDFVIRRRDRQAAYHLAVVVDDEWQGVTEVVRGADLLTSTARQILLQRALRYREPRYAHLPLLLEPDGRKLAKSRRAVPLEPGRAGEQLHRVLGWLAMEPPADLAGAAVDEIWDWAIANWRPERLAGRREIRLPAERPESG